MSGAGQQHDGLSEVQRQIVYSDAKISLIIAGPGSGKTRVLTHKVAHVLGSGVPESSMLLLTFTNKAAREMISRVNALVGRETAVLGGTFHHVANKFLRQHAAKFSLRQNYSIIDEEDAVRLMKVVLREEFAKHMDDLPKPEVLHSIFSYCRNSLTSIQDYFRVHMTGYARHSRIIGQVYERYSARKRASNIVDFDDLLVYFNALLDDAGFREAFCRRYTHIFVDEFQDTNRLQLEIVRKMYREGNVLFVVGDDCQSIYSFRAAEVMNILRFGAVFPGVKVFYLTENYRSTASIVRFVNEAIKANKNRYDKKLVPARAGISGEPPSVHVCDGPRDEAERAVSLVRSYLARGAAPESIAVLYRSNYLSAHLELELARHSIRYVKYGGLRFFEQAHIKDIIAFLKISGDMTDEIAWVRLLSLFDRIGEKTARAIWSKVAQSQSPARAIVDLGQREPRVALLSGLIEKAASVQEPAQRVRIFADEFYLRYLEKSFKDDASERKEDVEQLIEVISGYSSLDEFLEDSMLDANLAGAQPEGSIVLSTIHQAKGLEWLHVILIGAAQGKFPSRHSLAGDAQLEEERRLFYVACSRAMDTLDITVPLGGGEWGGVTSREVSQFIQELPKGVYSSGGAHTAAKRPPKRRPPEDIQGYAADFVPADQLL
ncbi:MAG: ATP-dependent helicase [Candidatus Micrarchaeia archaeon]